MECEDLMRAWLRITSVCKPGDDASAFIDERERFFVGDPLQLGRGVTRRLILDSGDLMAPFFRLSLYYTYRLLIEEQDVVRRADIGLIFANGNARTRLEIY